MQLTSIALFGEKGKGFRPRQSGPTRAAPALLARYSTDLGLLPMHAACTYLLMWVHQDGCQGFIICCRVEQLRLLSKAEQAGLLSLAERSGLTLSFIERSGLLSKAESLGLLSLATDR